MRALRERELEAERAKRGMVPDAADAASSADGGSGPLMLAPNGLPWRCAACRKPFEADADFFEFRCDAGCHVLLHLSGACRRHHAELYRKTHNCGAQLAFKPGMPCLTAVAAAGGGEDGGAACAGHGVLARQARAGEKGIVFDDREAVEKRQRAARAQALAEATARREAAEAATAAAAAAAEAVAAARAQRRAAMQQQTSQPAPSAAAEDEGDHDDVTLLGEGCAPVRVINRKAEAGEALVRGYCKACCLRVCPAQALTDCALARTGAAAEDAGDEQEVQAVRAVRCRCTPHVCVALPQALTDCATRACRGTALAIDVRLSAPRSHAREAAAAASFNAASWPLGGAWLPHANDTAQESSAAECAAAPREDAALAALRALICDAAATPFLLFEEVDFASLGDGGGGDDDDDGEAVRAWLHAKAAEVEACVAHVALFRPQRALAARCASAADAAALRALLDGQHGLRVQCLATMPDAAAIAAAAAPQRRFNPHAASFCPATAATTAAPTPSLADAAVAAAAVPGTHPQPALAPPHFAWANAQLVPMAPHMLQNCLRAGAFTLPASALAMRGAHGGVRPFPSPPPGGATALFLLDALTGGLHGVFCAIPTPPASAARAPAGEALHAFERRGEPGQPLPLRYAASALPSLRAVTGKAIALSGADATRLEMWMRAPRPPAMQLWAQAPAPLVLPPMMAMPSPFAASPFLMHQQAMPSAMAYWQSLPQTWHAAAGAQYGGGGFMPQMMMPQQHGWSQWAHQEEEEEEQEGQEWWYGEEEETAEEQTWPEDVAEEAAADEEQAEVAAAQEVGEGESWADRDQRFDAAEAPPTPRAERVVAPPSPPPPLPLPSPQLPLPLPLSSPPSPPLTASPERERVRAPLLPPRSAAAASSADDPFAALVAQHEADEALAQVMQTAEDAAARKAAAAPASFAAVAARAEDRLAAAAVPPLWRASGFAVPPLVPPPDVSAARPPAAVVTAWSSSADATPWPSSFVDLFPHLFPREAGADSAPPPAPSVLPPLVPPPAAAPSWLVPPLVPPATPSEVRPAGVAPRRMAPRPYRPPKDVPTSFA
jgi:hypothetical protein